MAVPPPPGYGGSTRATSGFGTRASAIPRPPGYRGSAGRSRLVRATFQGKTYRTTRKEAKSLAKLSELAKPGLLGDIANQVKDTVASLPSGIANLGVAAAEEIGGSPFRLVQGAVEGRPEEIISGIPVVGQGYGLARGFYGHSQSSNAPLTSLFGSSLRNTGERLTHPQEYLQAYREHRIVPALLEDVANISIVAGAGAKGLNAASRGSFARAAEARTAAEAAEKAVETTAKEAERLASRAAEHEAAYEQTAQLVDQAKGSSLRAQLANTADKARSVASDARLHADQAATAAEEARATAERFRAAADRELARAGRGYSIYRAARTVNRLGGQGAAAPAKPFEWAMAGFSKGSRELLAKFPALKAGLESVDDKVGFSRAIQDAKYRRTLAAQVRSVEGVNAADAFGYARAIDRMAKLAENDPVLYQTAIVADGLARAIGDQVSTLETLGTPEAMGQVDRLVREVSAGAHYEPEALRNALDIVFGRADPRLAARVAEIQDVYERKIESVHEKILAEEHGPGRRRFPSENQQAYADYNRQPAQPQNEKGEGLGLPPGTVEKAKAQEAEKLAALHEARDQVQQAAGEQLADLGVGAPVAGRTPSGRPRWSLPPKTVERLAARIGEKRAEGRIPGALRRVQQAARAEGRLSVATSAADRLRQLRASIPETVSDDAVQRLSDAVGRLQEVQGRLREQPELELADQGREAVVRARVPEVRQARARAVELARAELRALPDMPSSQALPFVPGDLSEYHQLLQEELTRGAAQRDFNIGAEADRLRNNLKGKARERATPEELFVRAYKRLWKKLPAVAKNALRQLSDDELHEMFRARARGEPLVHYGRLDTLAEEYAGARGAVGEEAIARLLGDYAHEARLREFLRRGGKGGWDEGVLDVLKGTSRDSALADFARSPEGEAVLGPGNLNVAAERLVDAGDRRAAEPFRGPNVYQLGEALADEPFPATPDRALELIADAYGGHQTPEFERFYDEWQRAGEPDLNPTLMAWDAEAENLGTNPATLEGGPPAWAREPQAAPAERAAPGEAAPPGVEEAAARGELESVVAKEGGQAYRGPLGREVGLLTMQAKNAETVVERGAGAEREAVRAAATEGAKPGIRTGRKLAALDRTLRELGLIDRQIEALPEQTARALDKLYRKVENAPAPYRHDIRWAREFTREIVRWRDEMLTQLEEGGNVDPRLLDTAEEMIHQGVNDVRDFFFAVSEPGGGVRYEERLPHPRYVPGGQPLLERETPPATGAEAKPIRASRHAADITAKGGARPRTFDELRVVLGQHIRSATRNDAARLVGEFWGRRSGQVLGDDANDLKPSEITAAMHDQPERYVPWDQEALFQSDPTKGAVVRQLGAEYVNAATLWIPETIFRAVQRYYGEVGTFERFMQKIDKGRNIWRAAVLALRPAWHVNNIVGNAFMAMVGAGMSPAEYLRRVRQAHALLSLPEAQLDVALPRSVVRTGLFKELRAKAAANPERLARLERRVGTIEPETRAALEVGGELVPPQTVTQRAAGAALLPEGEGAGGVLAGGTLRPKNRLQRGVEKSYAFNGAVDDMNRLAVFLSSRAKLTEAEVSTFQARYPELAGLSRDRVRTEGAVRISLKVAGDFLRMTPYERMIFRRVIPFYAWIRHITTLSLRLPLYSPARLAWVLHLASLFGDPQGDMGLTNTLPWYFGGTLLQLPALNPFGDTIEVSDPGEWGFNLSPEIKTGAGLFGVDVNRWSMFSRPPGQPGGYGGPPGPATLFDRPGEIPGLIASQFPQARVARAALDELRYGYPAMHYPLGQVRAPKSLGGEPLPTGQPFYGPLAQYLGVPFPRQPNYYEAEELRGQGRYEKPKPKLGSVRRRRRRAATTTTAPHRYGVPG